MSARASSSRVACVALLVACLSIIAAALAGSASAAPSATGETGTPSGTAAATCPSPNPPNALALVAGSPQTAALGTAFAAGLQVALVNSDGCPVTTSVAGTPVTFAAPTVGAGGLFAAGGASSITVGADASGDVSAPAFTANDIAGSYTLTASSTYGSVLFSLTNAASAGGAGTCGSTLAALAGPPAKVTAGVGATQATGLKQRFPIRLAVTVTDAEKNPVPGVPVTFSAPAHGPGGYFATGVRGARPHRVNVRTDACGIAVAPAFVANDKQGGYVVTAVAAHVRPAAFALVNAAPARQP